MELYFQVFSNSEQDTWVELLPFTEIAYNISVHNSMWMTPLSANYHYHLRMQLKQPKAKMKHEVEDSRRGNLIGDSRASPISAGECLGRPGTAIEICWRNGPDL
jgi:hypothetical protein